MFVSCWVKFVFYLLCWIYHYNFVYEKRFIECEPFFKGFRKSMNTTEQSVMCSNNILIIYIGPILVPVLYGPDNIQVMF